MSNEKLYPLNCLQYCDDFIQADEYIYNRLFDADTGEIEISQKEYDNLQDFQKGPLKELKDAYFLSEKSGHDGIIWLTDKQYEKAMNTIGWAINYKLLSEAV